MQIIIDIHEKDYHSVMYSNHVPYGVVYAIKNGTPLPKGHGDLVDFDRLCEEYWDGNYMEIHKDDLSNIKPIIEADKEGWNENNGTETR